MSRICILDSRRVCDSSCIAYEPNGVCRASGGGSRRRDYDDFGLREV
ncbi:MAG: hypothetical protein V1703_02640 [Candidatus Altiarchaeota archaeon]